ncbi:uncharacterized protein LOC107980750 [Nasonia vitripennis]|uniref:Uncharacterized protein n=1 Tax=Nasonia vitripennis TaxID=7425 RepID=A0A7M7IPT4_NASVI|nr:uncharacterized protein LOC107980750 [Nasonia vitripennis]XP_016838655.1 uncharacterized protein LOC107980750 [Nasonia vitripennis]
MISSSRKIRRVSDYLKLDKLIVWLWISGIFLTLVSSQDNFYASGRFGKRKYALSMSQIPLCSKFDRSEDRSAGNSLKDSSLFSSARFGRSEDRNTGNSLRDSSSFFPARYGRSEDRSTGNSLRDSSSFFPARFGRSEDRSTGNSLKDSSSFSPARYGRSEDRSSGNSLKESSFFSPGRYGRSEGHKNPKELPKFFEIKPRVDQFFIGSRYGKRSLSMLEPQPPLEALHNQRFEAAIDYLDRIKQNLAEAEEIEDETRDASRDDELVEAIYPNDYTGLSKI